MLLTAFVIILAVSFSVLVLYTLQTVQCKRARASDTPPLSYYPRVSILKPIKNFEDGLGDNLESFYTLDYPRYEIVFGVDSLQDEVVGFLREIQQKYRHIPTRIVDTGTHKILNPKIETLEKMAADSHGELYWVSDSNTRVLPDSLNMLVGEYAAKGSKIVFSPITGGGSGTVGSLMENAYINFFVSPNVITAWRLFSRPIIVGKSMLIERDALNTFGGFGYFKEYLAEDYCMGDVYTRAGIPLSTNFTWITNYNSTTTVRSFCARASRWAKMRYHIDRKIYLLEILINPLFIALFAAIILGRDGIQLFAAAYAGKMLLEYVNFRVVNELDRRKLWIIAAYPLAIVVKDLLLGIIYFVPIFSSTVRWRGRSITIGDKSRIIERSAS
ncbi:MAG: glycosyltransferase [Elusimicrobia bacterium]|nr:glycosyltransferase [Elusimicrobiota bacterium]